MKLSRKELRDLINEITEGFSHSGPDPAHALEPDEIMRMMHAGIDVANKDRYSPEAQPYLNKRAMKIGWTDDEGGSRTEIYDDPGDPEDDVANLRHMGDMPYSVDDSEDMLDQGTDIRSSMEALRDALRSGADLGPDDRDALLGVVDAFLNKR